MCSRERKIARETTSLALAELLRQRELANEQDEAGSVQAIVDAVRQHFRMDVAFISEFQDGRRIFRWVSCASADPPIRVGDADPLEASYCQRIADGTLPGVIHNAALIPIAAELPVTSALPVGGHLSVPIRLSDGGVFGTFCCFSHDPDPTLNDRNLSTLRVLGELAADIIERRARRAARRQAARARIRGAIDLEEFQIAYQPIFELAERRAVGLEALARFSDASERSPGEWFDDAREAELTVELELALIRRALIEWGQLPTDVYLALNVSPETATSGDLERMLEWAPQERVVIELTEHQEIEDYQQLRASLSGLRRRARLAVDDVGAGFSSLRHIVDLEPELIKLDASLIRNLHKEPGRAALVKALVSFASDLGMILVAEGVESAEEYGELKSLGVQNAQGFFMAMPLPLEAVRKVLRV
jgi:EAL domain-containing protein (putative c-di-GMP-specific phosphodiesterase class I)